MDRGVGQQGEMEFVRGNAAILNHIDKGNDLHLFAQSKKGFVRYICQMICTGYHYQAGSDTTGRTRRMIVFELTPLELFSDALLIGTEPLAEPDQPQLSLDDLRGKAIANARPATNAVERRALYYQRSQSIKAYALRRARGNCEGCGVIAPFQTSDGQPYLEVHHIRRSSDGGPDHPRWVVAICPNCHRRAHYAQDAEAYNDHLSKVAQKQETENTKTILVLVPGTQV